VARRSLVGDTYAPRQAASLIAVSGTPVDQSTSA
jgi:hypothetical protein